MGYRIELVSFSKKEKSTKVPGSFDLTISDCVLKEGSSLFTPQLKVKITNKESVNLAAYNFFYLSEKINNTYQYILGLFKVTNIENILNNIWLISGEIDPLGATRNQIMSSSQYVTRISVPAGGSGQSAYGGYDDRQYDTLCSPTTEIASYHRYTLSSGFSTTSMMTVIGFNGRNMEFFASQVSPQGIANSAINSDIEGLIEDNLGRYNDFFNTAKIFPFMIESVIDYPDSPAWMGTKQTYCAHGKPINVKDISGTHTREELSRREKIIPRSGSGQSARDGIACVTLDTEYDDFRRYDSRFTSVVANCPFVGQVDIDPAFLSYESINFTYNIDLLTGDAELYVYASLSGQDKTIGTYSCKIGIDVPISHYETNWWQIATNLYDKNVRGSIENLIAPPETKLTLSNLSGFATSLIASLYIDVKQYKSTEIGYTNFRGRPCNKYMNLGNLPSGTYVECLNPDLDIIKQDYIKQQVLSAMSSGIYLE